MGSEIKRREEETDKKIESYRSLIDSAYIIFDGKYSVKEIEEMPYRELIEKIDRERELSKEFQEYRAAKEVRKQFNGMR